MPSAESVRVPSRSKITNCGRTRGAVDVTGPLSLTDTGSCVQASRTTVLPVVSERGDRPGSPVRAARELR